MRHTIVSNRSGGLRCSCGQTRCRPRIDCTARAHPSCPASIASAIDEIVSAHAICRARIRASNCSSSCAGAAAPAAADAAVHLWFCYHWSPCRLALGVPLSVKRMKQYLSNARQLASTVMLDRMQSREESGQDSGLRALGLLTTLCSGLAPAPPSATVASSSRVGASMPCRSHLLPRPEKDYQDPGEFNGVL
jgi:hypothetical protein